LFRTGSKSDPGPDERPRSVAPQEDAMQDRAHQTAGDSALNALLGRGSEFDGKLHFEGTVRIDGTFTGEITTNDMLIIGEGAKVAADITCGSVVVNGEVTGNIKATDSVELHKPARVKGDITTPSLMIDKGVVFDGNSKMESSGSNLVSLNRRESGATEG
jgi:cytoskeletal protein CcmA (bactofilin family)